MWKHGLAIAEKIDGETELQGLAKGTEVFGGWLYDSDANVSGLRFTAPQNLREGDSRDLSRDRLCLK